MSTLPPELCDQPDQPRGKVLAFPTDDFRPPERVSWREWAAMEIAALRARRSRFDQSAAKTASPDANLLILQADDDSKRLEASESVLTDGRTAQESRLETILGPFLTPSVRSLPRRSVPDSEVGGRLTVNSAVRRVMPTVAEIRATEAAVRRLLQ